MKKIFALIFALSFVGSAFAQQGLPDGNFEQWKTGKSYQGTTYDELANPFWQTLNALSTLKPEMGTGPIVVFKDQGRSGFCPRMQSNELTLGTKTIFLPGVVGAFSVDILKQTAYFGRPYKDRPESIRGWMKYLPVANDSASIFVEIYHIGENGTRERIGNVEKRFFDTISEWTEFDLKIKYNSEATPDSISVLFVSSAGYNFDDLFQCKGQIGSTLSVDDCKFVFEGGGTGDTTSVENNSNQLVSKVYPNPAQDELTLSVEPNFNGKIIIYDPAGRMLKNLVIAGGENKINIADLKSGLYTYRILGQDKSGSGKFIKK